MSLRAKVGNSAGYRRVRLAIERAWRALTTGERRAIVLLTALFILGAVVKYWWWPDPAIGAPGQPSIGTRR